MLPHTAVVRANFWLVRRGVMLYSVDEAAAYPSGAPAKGGACSQNLYSSSGPRQRQL